MPMKSQAQRAAMHAAMEGKSNLGIPKKVAKKMVAHDTGGKLPKRAKPRYVEHRQRDRSDRG